MKNKMFNNAGPLLFARAKELRNNLTHPEMVLWGYLKTKPLGYKFRRQHPLGIYIADFFCYKRSLIIEVDGSIHNKEDIKRADMERQKSIESLGITVLRFTNDDVMKHFSEVVKKIELALHE
jgi:cyclase